MQFLVSICSISSIWEANYYEIVPEQWELWGACAGDELQEAQGLDAPHEEHDGLEEHYDPGDGFGGDDGYDDGHAQEQQPCAPLEEHADGSGVPAWLQGMLLRVSQHV